MIRIRMAALDDAESISRVHVESWKTTYRGIVPDAHLDGLNAEERTVRWREILKSTGRILVAEKDGEIVGFISGGPAREPLDGCDAELYAIYLVQQAQKQGIGRLLLVHLAKILDHENFRSMAVWVLEANAAAGFYAGTGAVSIGKKEITIGGAPIPAAAYAWRSLKSIIALGEES